MPKVPQLSDSFGRFRADRVIGVHIGGADDALLIDHIPSRHRQSLFRFVVKSVKRAAKRLVEVAQVVREDKDKPELLCRLQLKVG